ncbi:serine/threonine-protein kinase [Actomonas aquatica]|uniref:Protein kinase n=1 Tax=Actomonas aquatica TaxID=2866162 RepID=A0ABZ1C9X2_9BACT|nr:serine/threonine-protein kinase [Opitutus sp. WL0086]WRQ88326.1 protein kinase [Opitutus sp. WL0086]
MNRDDEVFGQALDLTGAEREAYLEKIGQEDPALRARVEALLKAYDSADDFMDASPVERPPLAPEEKLGDRIGHYTLIRKLGEGGCGVVYLAEQSEPVRRAVALKVIKLGMDTVEVIARFEAERQALAMMDHPDIARVFDAGATATGRPFFVMEFVDGVPITRFCDQQALPMAQRLELFARVCVALQHAHQKGIIHRDIKPSNILVSLVDGVPTPKVIDFGIAKATQGRLTEQTLLTCLNQLIGTPAYMSPEQAEARELDIDTRSDVYSLGVLLYELLTGRPPYDPRTLQQAGIDEIRRIIREIDPPRPSAAVSTLTAADRTTVAAARKAVPTRLTSVLAGDLDWIVMRCLEKQRDRRYGTASELAEDVRRHLRNEPVVARPPSWVYKTQRFVARNQLACGSAVAVLLAIIIGAIAATTQAIRATRAERVAVTERDAAETARAAEAVAREDAQRRQEQAEDLLTFMIGDFRAGLEQLGRLDLLDAVGSRAMDYFSELPARDLSDTALTRQTAALTQIGEVRMDQANYDAALTSFQAAFDRASTLSTRYPDNGDMLFERAQAEFWIGFVHRRRGGFAAEREWMTRYRDSAVALAALEPESLRSQHELVYGHHNLAVLDFDRGDYGAALQGFEAEHQQIVAMLRDHPEDLQLQRGHVDVLSWLGQIAEREGDFGEAERFFTEMGTLLERLMEVSGHPRWKLRHAQGLAFLGDLQARRNELSAARATNQQARSEFGELVEQDPANQLWQVSALSLELQDAGVALTERQFAEAEQMVSRCLPQLEALVAAEPTSRKFGYHLAAAARLDATLKLLHHQDPEAARAAIQWAQSLLAPLATGEVERIERYVLHEYAVTELFVADLARNEMDASAHRAQIQRVIDRLSPLLSTTHDWRLLVPAAMAHQALGQTDQAAIMQQRLTDIGYRRAFPFSSFDPQ